MSLHPPIEALEARIAPANFYLSGASKAVVNQAGLSVDDGDAATLAGSDVAVPLGAGDSLFLDTDGNPATAGDQTLLMRVTAGRALVFATDLGAVPDSHFDQNKITGLAVADGFEARLETGVRGSIVTALKEDGTLAVTSGVSPVLTLQHESIGGLNIDGTVAGNIFAGGDIRHVRVTGSVEGNIATGTAVNESVNPLNPLGLSLNGSTTIAVAAFAPSAGTRGGDISDLQLPGGVKNVLAGDGDNDDVLAPGRGGSISNVAITIDVASTNLVAPTIRAGDGGISNTGAGARGGSLSGITIILSEDVTDSLQLLAGNGGRGSGTGQGGAGGAITNCTVISSGSIGGALRIVAGAGGNAGDPDEPAGNGSGGVGGAVTNTTVHLLSDAVFGVDSLIVSGGAGGDSEYGAGGAGGALVDLELFAAAAIGSGVGSIFDLTGGAGGSGKSRGGAGGAIDGGAINVLGDVQVEETVNIRSGDGGALNANTTKSTAIAGRGGAISGLALTLLPELDGASFIVATGVGGSAEDASVGNGGAGGRLSASISGSGVAALSLEAGAGGAASAGGTGGAGGSVVETTVTLSGILDSFSVLAGDGTEGGAGGNLRALRIALGGVSETVILAAGDAGEETDDASGAGGVVTAVQFTNFGELEGGLQITGGIGSPGGAVTNCTVTNAGGMDFLEVTGGDGGAVLGGAAKGAGGSIGTFVLKSLAGMGELGATFKGGAGGDSGDDDAGAGSGGGVRGLTVHLLDAPLLLIGGDGGESSTSKAGGAGGAIRDIVGAVDIATFIAGNGGDSSGKGGNGGAIREVSLGLVGSFVRGLLAGDGGDGSKAGAGGAVRNVVIAGDVGDFGSEFNFAADEGELDGMGGVAAGQAGAVNGRVAVTKNGSIINVTAARIAAMVAGRPDAEGVTSANAVLKIAKITAPLIGADVGSDGNFYPADFDPRNPDNTSAAMDGFILVRASGLSPLNTAVVLKLFEA
jgi:hypothetical protein